MDTHKKIREHISALSDGELSSSDVELALAALQGADGERTWNTYFRIGDELRAKATPLLSDAFSARLAARLAAEPAPLRRGGGAASGSVVTGSGGASAVAAEGAADVPAKPITARAS